MEATALGGANMRPVHARADRDGERITLTQAAVGILRDMIVLGEIPPGEPLRLEELANKLEMSASPIREAIRQLEMIGFVTHAPYRGATVTRLSYEEMSAVYETRIALESLIVRRVAERLDSSAEERLVSILAELDDAYAVENRIRVVRGNTAFHVALAASSGSPWLERLIKQVHDVWERYSAALIPAGQAEQTFVAEARGHREILHACQAGDADTAEEALRGHLDVSRAIFERISAPRLLHLDDRVRATANSRRVSSG